MTRRGIYIYLFLLGVAFRSTGQYQTLTHDTAICLGSPVVLKSFVLPGAGTTKYTFQHVNYNWLTPDSVIVVANMGDDEVRGPLPIGFTFNFLCVNYTSFFLGSNGWISFGVKNENSFHPQSIPDENPLTPKN